MYRSDKLSLLTYSTFLPGRCTITYGPVPAGSLQVSTDLVWSISETPLYARFRHSLLTIQSITIDLRFGLVQNIGIMQRELAPLPQPGSISNQQESAALATSYSR
jgi:hypothetical protein